MIGKGVPASAAKSQARLDARYFLSPGVHARAVIAALKAARVPVRSVGGPNGVGRIQSPTRSTRVYGGAGEVAVPYLRPYDVFDYLPQAADYLSVAGSSHLDTLRPSAGTILQTCSGRNLGPVAYVDSYLATFAVSDDMLRLTVDDEDERLFTLAFLGSAIGQALLSQNKTGGVIDHLSPTDFGAVEVPFPPGWQRIAETMREAVGLRDSSRVRLAAALGEFERALGVPPPSPPRRVGWAIAASQTSRRLDAAFHDPGIAGMRAFLADSGGVRCQEVADAYIPGRYTRYYVDATNGRPIVSGRQLLQTRPIGLRFIAARSFDFGAYQLSENMLAFGAEGRAEERLGFPVLITEERAEWLANNHVMRVVPRAGVHPGWLYLAFAAQHTLVQTKAYACGSVVDTVYPRDVADIVLPPDQPELSDAALRAWGDLARANVLEAASLDRLNEVLSEVADVPDAAA